MILPRKIENLLMAGRAVTDEFKAHMSTRNTASCMVMGQAAGTSAALCVKSGYVPKTLPYAMLRQRLLADKVILE